MEETKEPQYQRCLDLRDENGLSTLGLFTNQDWHDDPKHLVFMLSRYKFVAKMFSGLERVLEIGCGDAWGARIVKQEVGRLTVTDFDPVLVEDIKERLTPDWPMEAVAHDLLTSGPVEEGAFNGAYLIDVIEHVDEKDEHVFMDNIVKSLCPTGVCLVGTPTIQSQVYASPLSKAGHINCKDGSGLKKLMSEYFHSVFLFSMNDEVVHTGYAPMAHYLWALCAHRK